MQHVRVIRLYGPLGTKFGRVHRFSLDTGSVSEAIKALSSQIAEFYSFLINAKDKGIGFSIFIGKKNISIDEIGNVSNQEEIRIAPILLGSKNGGIFNIILGTALVIAASYFGGPGAGAAAAKFWGAVNTVGIGFIVSGVVQLISPQPKGLKLADRPDNQPSYVFNGAVNTQAQGNPVPLLYGRMIVGSAVISAGINAEDYAPATAGVGAGTNLAGRSLKTPYDRFEA